jgi:DeoR family transcriptional regulator of aga operon
LLLRTHGGAVVLDQFVRDLPFDEKTSYHLEEKRLIGRTAAHLVEDGDSLILDSGSTTLQIVRNIRTKKDLIVATASVHIAHELLDSANIELLMLGGPVRFSSGSTVGPYAEEILRDHAFKKLFIAGDGLDLDYGLTTTETREAHLNRAMIDAAQQTIAVVDSSKIGRRGLCRICGVEQLETVVIDEGISEKAFTRMSDLGIRIVIAGAKDGSVSLVGGK